MTDTPDYLKRNPKVLLGNTAVAQVETNPEKLIAPVLQIYNADGTPHLYEAPSDAEEEALLDLILAHVDGQDVRRVLRMLQTVEQAVQSALLHALAASHMVAHSEQYNAGYDEETLCDGVHAYLDPERAMPAHHHGETPDAAEMLKQFFPNGLKPN